MYYSFISTDIFPIASEFLKKKDHYLKKIMKTLR